MKKAGDGMSLAFFMVRLAAHISNGWKSLIRPSSGKDTAKIKGVVGDHESEGRWRQISGLTNRNHIRLQLRIRLPYKPKSNNYSELTVVNVADIWRERNVWYQGRSRQRTETNGLTVRVWNPWVTTNGEKSAEAIVKQWLQTLEKGRTLGDVSKWM